MNATLMTNHGILLDLDGTALVPYEEPKNDPAWLHGIIHQGGVNLSLDEAAALGRSLMDIVQHVHNGGDWCSWQNQYSAPREESTESLFAGLQRAIEAIGKPVNWAEVPPSTRALARRVAAQDPKNHPANSKDLAGVRKWADGVAKEMVEWGCAYDATVKKR